MVSKEASRHHTRDHNYSKDFCQYVPHSGNLEYYISDNGISNSENNPLGVEWRVTYRNAFPLQLTSYSMVKDKCFPLKSRTSKVLVLPLLSNRVEQYSHCSKASKRNEWHTNWQGRCKQSMFVDMTVYRENCKESAKNLRTDK